MAQSEAQDDAAARSVMNWFVGPAETEEPRQVGIETSAQKWPLTLTRFFPFGICETERASVVVVVARQIDNRRKKKEQETKNKPEKETRDIFFFFSKIYQKKEGTVFVLTNDSFLVAKGKKSLSLHFFFHD